MRTARLGGGSRTAFISVLLLLALVLTVGVAWQAHDAARSHRETAEAVLHDYAALAAGEMIRRSVTVFTRGYSYHLKLALDRVAADGGDLPAPHRLDTGGRESVARALEVARFFLRYRLGDLGSLEIAGDPLTPEERRWLLRWLEGDAPGFPSYETPYVMIFGPAEAPVVGFYWAAGPTDGEGVLRPGTTVLGVGLERRELRRIFNDAVESGSVLPEALADGEVGNELLRITVYDWLGEPLFVSRTEFPYRGAAQARLSFGDETPGILHDWSVRAEIAPEAAPRLIIGGLPRTRLPALLGLLVLAGGLMAAALWLLSRERELARLRSDFVSRVSHELRTPLTQIRMFSETLLLDRVRSPAERRRSLEIVDGEARRLSHLVENILQLSRSERGALQVTPRRRNLSALLDELVTELEPLVVGGRLGDGNPVRLRSSIEPGVFARVDADALHQIVLNLLDNAVKYGAPKHGTAEVRLLLRRRTGRAELVVEDRGPGIPRRERGRVWERFHRLARDSEVTGTGIGLAVVRELVEAHGGRVRVEEGEDGGARFVVELEVVEPEVAEEVSP